LQEVVEEHAYLLWHVVIQVLNLAGNCLRKLPWDLGWLQLKHLNVSENQELQMPPAVLRRGLKAVMSYLQVSAAQPCRSSSSRACPQCNLYSGPSLCDAMDYNIYVLVYSALRVLQYHMTLEGRWISLHFLPASESARVAFAGCGGAAQDGGATHEQLH
jgi:hypothetical protein